MKPIIVFLLAATCSTSALAYTGPGLGLGLIGTILGVLFSILLAVLAIFWYPLKRMLKLDKRATAEQEATGEEPQPTADSPNQPSESPNKVG